MIVLAEDRVPLELDCISYRILREEAQPDRFRVELLYERKEFRCNIVQAFTTGYPNLPYTIPYIVEMLFHKLSNELSNKDLVVDMHNKNIKQLRTVISHSLSTLLKDEFSIGRTI